MRLFVQILQSKCIQSDFIHSYSTLNVLWCALKIYITATSNDINSGLNTLRPRQNGRHFPDEIFRCIFFNENIWIAINISPSFVPTGPIDNIPSLGQIMVWRRPGDNPLSEPMTVRLPTHIYVTRPQWVNVALNCYVHIRSMGRIIVFYILIFPSFGLLELLTSHNGPNAVPLGIRSLTRNGWSQLYSIFDKIYKLFCYVCFCCDNYIKS